MIRMLEHPSLMEAALFRGALATHFDHLHPGIASAQCCHVLAASCTNAVTRMRRSELPLAAAAWAVSRVGVALFLLAAADRHGHAGLLSRVVGH